MKICFIAPGESFHTRKWVKGFASLGHETYLITDKHFAVKNATIFVQKYSLFNFGPSLVKIRSTLNKIKPDLVNGHYLTCEGLFAVNSGIKPAVVSCWGSDILRAPDNFILRMIIKYVIKRANLITADAEIVRKKLIMLGTPGEKIMTIPMGVEREEFEQIVSIPRPSGRKAIISTRMLIDIYQIDIIIRAMKRVLAKIPEAKLYIVGVGEKKREYQRLIKKLNLANSVKFLGYLGREELLEFYKKSDIFVSIPVYDATSVSLLEAMSAGCFPVVSDIGANREWVKEDRGAIVPVGNERILAEKIIDALKNEDLIKKAAEDNRNLIREKAIWENNLRELESAYLNLI